MGEGIQAGSHCNMQDPGNVVEMDKGVAGHDPTEQEWQGMIQLSRSWHGSTIRLRGLTP